MKSCPVCRLFMDPVDEATVTLWRCLPCRGVWIPAPHAEDVLKLDPHRFKALISAEATSRAGTAFTGLIPTCPDCLAVSLENEMKRPELLGSTRRCPNCGGLWLQRDVPSEREASVTAGTQPEEQASSESSVAGSVVAGPEVGALVEPPPVEPLDTALRTAGPVALVEPPVTGAEDALKRLLEGNQRFVHGLAAHPNATLDRVREVAGGQKPFAVVLTCSDSRVSPEIIFDRGIGDIFVVRTAGNVVTNTVMGGILYAVDHLEAPLVLVMGHTSCGAVNAALSDRGEEGYLASTLRAIRPAVELSAGMAGSHGDNAARVHVLRTVARVAETIATHLPQRVDSVRVMGAMYDTATGHVTVLEEPLAAIVSASTPKTATPGDEPVQVRVETPSPSSPSVQFSTATREETRAQRFPDAPASSAAVPPRYSRWCPKCREGYGDEMAFCTRCGVLLVLADYVVRCLRCGRDNVIGNDRCYHCRADLHPSWLTQERRKGTPLLTRRSYRSGTTWSCGTEVLVVAAMGAILWTLWAAVPRWFAG